LGPCTKIGNNNFLSSCVNLEHHNRLGSYCTFGPSVSTSGEVVIGDDVKFGTGIFIEPCVKIGENSVVASGAILVGAVPANSIVKTKLNYTISRLSS
jgi:acetyltransferase-like isoleucine patch superfamily enzyme